MVNDRIQDVKGSIWENEYFMISRKFSNTSDDQIIDFLCESSEQKECDSILDSIESVSDLWILANMNETYNEEDNIPSSLADTYPDECFPR